MKKYILFLMFTLITLVSFGQDKENYIKDNFFYTKLESGIGEIIPMKFKFNESFLNKIQKNETYLFWENQTFSNPENEAYIEANKNKTHIEMYITQCVAMASFYARLDLKNKTSYTPILNANGYIYINDENEIAISFPFKAQNSYGNMVFANAYYIDKSKNGKREKLHFISTN